MHGTVSDTDGDRAWVFGYGSLIYKVDFPILDRAEARIDGWARRFWQGSHDHRGTPESPGRVLTLVRSPGTRCRGVAYRVSHEVFDHLDHREKNGYARYRLPMEMLDHEVSTTEGVIYVAEEGNPAWLGPAPIDEMARHIATSEGPSGPNADYLHRLADALRERDEVDEHVFELDRRVRALRGESA
ncbi:gamma-glutamylcyclotransferase [Halomonas denitrificans]|nr:gamma-glutamylcyclotransferase [Halomonas denitrificans]